MLTGAARIALGGLLMLAPGQLAGQTRDQFQRPALTPLFTGSFAPPDFRLAVYNGAVFAAFLYVRIDAQFTYPGPPEVSLFGPGTGKAASVVSLFNRLAVEPLPDGTYSARFTFPAVFPPNGEFLLTTPAGTTTCKLVNAYAPNGGFCETMVQVVGGRFFATMQMTTTDGIAFLKQITITRWF